MNEQTQAIYDKIEGNRFEVEHLQGRIAKRDWRAVRKILTTNFGLSDDECEIVVQEEQTKLKRRFDIVETDAASVIAEISDPENDGMYLVRFGQGFEIVNFSDRYRPGKTQAVFRGEIVDVGDFQQIWRFTERS